MRRLRPSRRRRPRRSHVDASDTLSTIAAASVGLAGFSGVMTAFMQRPGTFTSVERYRVAVLLGVSFGGMFLAFLPLTLAQFRVEEPRLWGHASLVMVLYSAAALTLFLVSSHHFRRQVPGLFNAWLFWAITIGHVVNIGLQASNTLQPVAGTASGLYIVGLLWYLVHAAVQFSRILIVQPGSS